MLEALMARTAERVRNGEIWHFSSSPFLTTTTVERRQYHMVRCCPQRGNGRTAGGAVVDYRSSAADKLLGA